MAVRAPSSQSSANGAFSASVITLRTTLATRDSRYFFWKRTLDVIISATLLVVFSPVMLLAALAISLNTPGPVLFRQRRVGKHQDEFLMLKFRSMRHNVSSRKHQEAIKTYMADQKLNGAHSTNAPFKLINDNRITRVGVFIRKTSIDELPQLWNVLTGEMSMVGPRPPIPYEVEGYNSRAMERFKAKPGITGPWQVYGRNKVTFSEMIAMDIAYIDNRSILYDLKLMALTLPAAISGE